MEINFNLCDAEDLRADLVKFQAFKNRWFQLLSGYNDIEIEDDAKISSILFDMELTVVNLIKELDEAKAKVDTINN